MSKLRSLQALRGLAASLVVLSHLMRQTHEDWPGITVVDAHAIIVGKLGVYVFFIVSGFIMQYTAGGTFGEPGAPARFLRRRLARVVPLYWTFTALAVAFPGAVYLGTHRTAIGVISSFVFLPDMSAPPYFTPALPVGWTLDFEMLFYVVFAMCLNFPRKIGVPLLFIGLYGFFVLTNWLAHAVPVMRDFAQWWSSQLLALFVIGVLLAIASAKTKVSGDLAVAGFLIAIVLFLATVVRSMFIFDPPVVWLLMVTPIAVVALCTLLGDVPDGPFMKALIWLGDRSYTLYLAHLFLLGISSAIWLRLFGARWSLGYDVLMMCLCVSSCGPIYYIEVRLTKLARGALSGANMTPAICRQTSPIPLRSSAVSCNLQPGV